MAIKIDFAKKYAHLINDDLPKVTLSIEDDSDIPMVSDSILKEYKKSFIHTKESFVEKYCKDYDKTKRLIKRNNTINRK